MALELCSENASLMRFQLYHPEHKYWLRASEGHSVLITPGQHLFVAALGVSKLLELQPVIDAYAAKTPLPVVPHLRKNLAAERESVRAQNHAALIASAEVLQAPMHKAIPHSKPTFRPHPSLGPLNPSLLPQKRKATNIKTEDVIELSSDEDSRIFRLPSGIHGSVININDSSSEANSNSSQSSQPSSDDGLGNSDSDSGAVSSGNNRAWPRDFLCWEIHEGFIIMDREREHVKSSLSEAFFKAFPSAASFSPTTYHDNRNRWKDANDDLRELALSRKDTAPMNWKTFASTVPIRGANVRAARKKAKSVQSLKGKEKATATDEDD
jgi:hypothetical protein